MGFFSRFSGAPAGFAADFEPLGERIQARADQTLLQSALDAGLPLAHSCRVGSCGSCKCRLLSGKVQELTDSSYVLTLEDIEAGYILACQSRPKSDVRVHVNTQAGLTAGDPVRETEAQITALRPLTHDILEVRVMTTEPLRYRAGQYANLRFAGLDRPRSYSFASAPAPDGPTELRFFIRRAPGGGFTEWLFAEDRTGAVLQISSALGAFGLEDTTAPMLLVAGGSGLAPILALLEAALAQSVVRDAFVFFGARTREDLYCASELEALRAAWRGRFEFTAALSAEPDQSDWAGRRGPITEFLSEAPTDFTQAEAYLCGPPPMVDAALARVLELGVERRRVHFDRFVDSRHMSPAASS
jgi:ferredoxin-NADP reductase/ferredoxin